MLRNEDRKIEKKSLFSIAKPLCFYKSRTLCDCLLTVYVCMVFTNVWTDMHAHAYTWRPESFRWFLVASVDSLASGLPLYLSLCKLWLMTTKPPANRLNKSSQLQDHSALGMQASQATFYMIGFLHECWGSEPGPHGCRAGACANASIFPAPSRHTLKV